MPQRGKDGGRHVSGVAAQAAEVKSLGTLVGTLPVRTRRLIKFKDTGHLVHRFEQGFVDEPVDGAPRAMRYDQIS